MASKYWLKLFHETIYDPKVMMMSPGARLRFYECLCLAGDYDKEGELPATQHMVYVFRVSEDQLIAELKELVAAGIFDRAGDTYTIRKFGSRQAKMEVKDRVERFRKSKRNEEYEEQKQSSNEPVTNCYTDIDKEEDTDKIKIKINNKTETSSKSPSDAEFFAHFGNFNNQREQKRWIALVESVGFEQAQHIAEWAEKKEINMTNRMGLMDSMETAAKNWKAGSNKPGNNKVGINDALFEALAKA